MKILRVTLENLASYDGCYTIDFTSAPLKDAGLYSIVGHTGSGKSTILDAICLALYGTAPRFEAATDLKYFDNKEAHINERDKILRPGDTRNILRKGARKGRAEVEFIANDGERYRAIWSVRYGKTRYTPRERTLLKYIRNDDGTEKEEVLFKRNADDDLFKQVIGLDYEQFTRTIMLAQNSFANFIKCDGKEKAKLLERLTGTEIYTRIAIRINTHFKEAQQRLEDFKKKMEIQKLDLLPDEEREKCEKELVEADERLRKLEEESKSVERQIDWLHRRDNARTTLQKDQTALNDKRQEWNMHAEEEKELAIYSRLIPVSPAYGNLSQTENDLEAVIKQSADTAGEIKNATQLKKDAEQRLEANAKAYDAAQKAYDDLQPVLKEARRILSVKTVKEKDVADRKKNYEDLQEKARKARQSVDDNLKKQKNLKDSLKEAEDALDALRPFEAPLRQVGVILKSLDSLKQINDKIHTGEQLLETIRTELQELKKTEEDLKTKETNRKKVYEATCTQLRQQEDLLKGRDGNALRKATNEAKDKAGMFKDAADCWVAYWGEEKHIVQLQEEIEACTKHISGLKKTEEELTKKHQEQEDQLPGLQTAYQLLISESVGKMRAALKENTPCPVCGALHHPYAETKPEDSAVRLLKEQLAEVKKTKSETEKQLNALHEQIAGENGILANKKDELKTATGSLPDKKEKWNACISLDVSLAERIGTEDKVNARRRYDFLKEKQAEFENLYQKCQKEEEEFSGIDSRCRELQKQKDEELQAWRKIEQDRNSRRLAIAGKEQEAAGLDKQLQEDRLSESTAVTELDGYGLEDNWKELWTKDTADYTDLWHKRSQKWEASGTKKEQAASDLKSSKAAFDTLLKQSEEADKLVETARTTYQKGKNELQDLDTKLNGYCNGKQPDDMEQEAKDNLNNLQKLHEELSRKVNDARMSVEKLQTTANGQNERKTQLEQQKEALTDTIKDQLEQSGADVSFEKLKWYLDKERNWENLRTLLTGKKEKLKELEGRVQAGQQLLDSIEKEKCRTGSEEKELQVQLQSLQTTTGQEKKTRQELSNKLENDRTCRYRLEASMPEHENLEKIFKNWEELNKLMGANQGDDIRQAAQCYTLQFLVAHANRQLKMLTSRYRLVQVPDSLSLRIKDMDYAGEERNISSLSGGETFLVSLALALGLSAISSGNHNYGMLFIDEGFGTLDKESLNTVIDALSSLQSIQGKKVGVISHTDEMRERIPVQIQVIKGNAEGKSSLRVV